MGDEFATDAGELTAGYALYGTTGWDDVTVYDSAGLLWRRDLHAETGLSPNLVRISWGGARHRDRYRWASWSGRLRIDGTAVEHVTPWAITHPEQIIDVDGSAVAWDTKTYGADIGIVIRLADLSRARFELEATVQEDRLHTGARLSGRSSSPKDIVTSPSAVSICASASNASPTRRHCRPLSPANSTCSCPRATAQYTCAASNSMDIRYGQARCS